MKLNYALVFTLLLLHTYEMQAQKVGERRTITLKLNSYICESACTMLCEIEFEDIEKGIKYDFCNVDRKIDDNGIIKRIQDLYYEADEDDRDSRGQLYTAVLEFKYVNKCVVKMDPEGIHYWSTLRKKEYKWKIIKLRKKLI